MLNADVATTDTLVSADSYGLLKLGHGKSYGAHTFDDSDSPLYGMTSTADRTHPGTSNLDEDFILFIDLRLAAWISNDNYAATLERKRVCSEQPQRRPSGG